MPLQEYDQISLKDEIAGTLGDREAIDKHPNRTPGKDEVAQYIQDEVVDKGRWPVQMVQLADETGYSRQHVANCVTDYFKGVDESDMELGDPAENNHPMSAGPSSEPTNNTNKESTGSGDTRSVFVRVNNEIQEVEISIPDNVKNRETYVRGYLDAVERLE